MYQFNASNVFDKKFRFYMCDLDYSNAEPLIAIDLKEFIIESNYAPSDEIVSGQSLFLAGGITNCPDWQSELLEYLSDTDLTIYNPRRLVWDMNDPTTAIKQIEWEHERIASARSASFWFPCETLCPITLFELGKLLVGKKPLFIGCHPDYKRILDVTHQTLLERPLLKIHHSLEELAEEIKLG